MMSWKPTRYQVQHYFDKDPTYIIDRTLPADGNEEVVTFHPRLSSKTRVMLADLIARTLNEIDNGNRPGLKIDNVIPQG